MLPRLPVRSPAPVAAAGLLVADVVVRLLAGGPYRGATGLLVTACGLAVVWPLRGRVESASARAALAAPLGAGVFALAVITLSSLGVPLTERSLRAAAWAVVAAALAAATSRRGPSGRATEGREAAAFAGSLAIAAFALAASVAIVRPFPPPGSDWGYYLRYADAVAAHRELLVSLPPVAGSPSVLGNYPGIGALYGSVRILDGVPSESLAYGIAVSSAVGVLALFGAAAALWGPGAGLVAAAVYAASPARMDPTYWHGVGTTAGLIFFPLLLLATGLLCRRGPRAPAVGLLGLALAATLAAHVVAAVVTAVMLVFLAILDAARSGGRLARRASPGPELLRDAVVVPLAGGVGLGALLGAGVIVHLLRLFDELGPPVAVSELGRIGMHVFVDQIGRPLTVAAFVAVALVAALPHARRDPALLAVGVAALAALGASQLWRLGIAFDYRRGPYYLDVPVAMVVGYAAVAPRRRRALTVVPTVALAVYVAHVSIGLGLPRRLVTAPEPRPSVEAPLRALGRELDAEGSPATLPVVADACLGVRVPYLVGRPTLVAADDWQAGFRRLLPAARAARAILDGGAAGRSTAARLGVTHVVVDPGCSGDVAGRLGGEVRSRTSDVLVVDLRDG